MTLKTKIKVKKYILLAVALISMLLLPVTLLAAQVTEGIVEFSLEGSFVTFTAIVAAIPFLVEGVKTLFKPQNKTVIQMLSWLVGVAFVMFGWWLGLGFLATLLWWQALVVGLFASMAANGLWDTGLYEAVLRAMGFIKY